MSILSGGVAGLSLSLRVAVADLERERDSLRRFLLASLDLDRFLALSLSLERDRDRLRFLLCLLLLECLDRDELRLLERPMITSSQTFPVSLCSMAEDRTLNVTVLHLHTLIPHYLQELSKSVG